MRKRAKAKEKKSRVKRAKATMDRIAMGGMKMEQKIRMMETAAIPKAIYGTELDPLNKEQKNTLRRKASWITWGRSRWLRGATPTMTLIVKGHRGDPRQAQPYHQLSIWRRMLQKSRKIKRRAEDIWNLRREQGIEMGKGAGPTAVLEKAVVEIGWTWSTEFHSFQREGKVDLPLIGQDSSWWGHEVREDLRNMLWSRDNETLKRESFKGAEKGVDHTATTELYREKVGHKKGDGKCSTIEEEQAEEGTQIYLNALSPFPR